MASTCWENPDNKNQCSAKSAQILPAEPFVILTQEELAKKARKREKNKKYKKQKREKDKAKKLQEEAKKADEAKGAQTVSSEEYSTEEASRRKTPMASRSSRVLGGLAKKSLFQELNSLSEEEIVEIGREMDRCYKAKTAVEEEDSAMTFGELHSKLVGERSSREAMLMDSGCTRDIVAQAIVSDLGLNIQK